MKSAQNHVLKLIIEGQTLFLNTPKIISPHNFGKVSGLINYNQGTAN